MGIARLREGIKWVCSECNKVIPTGEGIQLNRKPYCEKCAYIELERFEIKMRKLKKANNVS